MANANLREKRRMTPDEQFEDALRRIYRVYGPDLSAFFSDVQHRLNLERSEDSDKRNRAPFKVAANRR